MKCMGCKHDAPDCCHRGYPKFNSDRCPYYDPAKIYICGKITGEANYLQKFATEEKRLSFHGYEAVNPAAIVFTRNPNMDWKEAMRIVLCKMLGCDGISLLPDWKKSKGAKIEAKLAKALGIEVRDSVGWK